MNFDLNKTPFVTFYSFKGGVGRSMALINTACILAGRRGFRVLVLDLDLEAPGLTYLDPESPDQPSAQCEFPFQLGFVDLVTDALERGEDADLFKLSGAELEAKYTRKVKMPESVKQFPDGSLVIMPSGKCDRTYAERLDAMNLNALYREGVGEPLIRAFKNKLVDSNRYDYVLVDSRTGISEVAGICTRDLADHIMVLSGLNRQNVEGTSEFLRELSIATTNKKSVQIILSPMPNGEDELLDKRRAVAISRFQEAWGERIDLSLEIPYHPQLALTEDPHIFRRQRGYLYEAYLRIEAQMLRNLGHTAFAFSPRIIQFLSDKKYQEALRDLKHIIRLDNGRFMLNRILGELMREIEQRKDSSDKEANDIGGISRTLQDEHGRAVIKFLVQELPLDDVFGAHSRFIIHLNKACQALADEFVDRFVQSPSSQDSSQFLDLARNLQRENDFRHAERIFKRGIERNPKNKAWLASYADLLREQRRYEESTNYYKTAVEADPKDANLAHSYGDVLMRLKRVAEAEQMFELALKDEPNRPITLGDYGQLLAGSGRYAEAKESLLKSFSELPRERLSDIAEVCFSLWLVTRLQEDDASGYERQFKYIIARGFEREPWDFDRMLQQGEHNLSPDEFRYAQALAAAFLDDEKVAELTKIPRWQALEPLAPEGISKFQIKSRRIGKTRKASF